MHGGGQSFRSTATHSNTFSHPYEVNYYTAITRSRLRSRIKN